MFSTVIPIFLQSYALKRMGANAFAMLGSLGPVTTILAGYAFLGETIDRARGVTALSALPGNRAATPGFSRPAHLKAMLAHGTPPIPLLARLIGAS